MICPTCIHYRPVSQKHPIAPVCAWSPSDEQLAHLREENARLRKDAARYRWLVSRARSEMAMDRWRGYMWGVNGICDPDCKGFVAAIDAARAGVVESGDGG